MNQSSRSSVRNGGGTAVNVAVVDYGLGNLRSVCNAISHVGGGVFIAQNPSELSQATHVILPGVGAFGDGVSNLERQGWIEPIRRLALEERKPLLGICLGMQLLAQSSTEQGLWKGLELIEGKVERLASTGGLRIPHVGWNDVRFRESLMYQKLTSPQDYYFLHSFALMEDTESVNGTCDYGTPFVASLENGNIWGCQFHPEKSQSAGLQILKNFIDLAQC